MADNQSMTDNQQGHQGGTEIFMYKIYSRPPPPLQHGSKWSTTWRSAHCNLLNNLVKGVVLTSWEIAVSYVC